MSLNDDSYERQPERAHICTNRNSCVTAVTFGLVVWKGSAYRIKAAEILFHADALLLFPKMPQVCMPGCTCVQT